MYFSVYKYKLIDIHIIEATLPEGRLLILI